MLLAMKLTLQILIYVLSQGFSLRIVFILTFTNFQPILDECDIVDDGSGMVERKPIIIEKLLFLTRSSNMSIRLNAVWALMVSSTWRQNYTLSVVL